VIRPVEAVFFDLYGTLVDLAGLEAACEAAVPGRGAELAVRWRARQLEATWLRTCMGRWADFEQVTAEALDVTAEELALDADGLTARLAGAWHRLQPRAGVPVLLERLAAARLPTGVLSNGSSAMLRATLDGAALTDRFAHLLSADAARAFKPARAVYRLATDATDLPPGRIGFVTANGWDAAGAAAFGFLVAWLQQPGGSLPAVGHVDRRPTGVTVEEVASLFGA